MILDYLILRIRNGSSKRSTMFWRGLKQPIALMINIFTMMKLILTSLDTDRCIPLTQYMIKNIGMSNVMENISKSE